MMDLKLFVLGILVAGLSAREIELESFKPSKDTQDLIDYGTVRVTKVKKNHYTISGDFVLKRNIANDQKLIFEVFMENSAVLIRNQQPVCDFFKNDKLVWSDILAASNMPQNNPCPFPKGNYSIKNFVVDDKKFGMVPPGKFLARASFIEGGKVITHVDIDAISKL